MNKIKQNGGGIFLQGLKGTLGVMTGLFIYWFLVFLCMVGFVGGVVLFIIANNNTCTKREKRPVTSSRTVNGRTETTTTEEEVCVESKPINQTSKTNQTRYYAGIVMMIVFGIILLVVFLPYIAQGFFNALGWYFGQVLTK